jgi:hypothetical protein
MPLSHVLLTLRVLTEAVTQVAVGAVHVAKAAIPSFGPQWAFSFHFHRVKSLNDHDHEGVWTLRASRLGSEQPSLTHPSDAARH